MIIYFFGWQDVCGYNTAMCSGMSERESRNENEEKIFWSTVSVGTIVLWDVFGGLGWTNRFWNEWISFCLRKTLLSMRSTVLRFWLEVKKTKYRFVRKIQSVVFTLVPLKSFVTKMTILSKLSELFYT